MEVMVLAAGLMMTSFSKMALPPVRVTGLYTWLVPVTSPKIAGIVKAAGCCAVRLLVVVARLNKISNRFIVKI